MHKHFMKAGGAALTLALLSAGVAVHSNSSTQAIIKAAEGDARDATRALEKGKVDVAVRSAEHAVQLRPQDATYRALLGKAYLAAGRFFSAKQAFADALQLDAGLPGVALNLALATTATGDFAAAQAILQANAGSSAPADRGLAFALAGNPAAAVEILLPAARAADSDAKTRQNLALAFALAGRWPDARQVALTDLSPADVDARIVQWAAFARPAAASDQVAALLGVTPVADSGLPVQLALVSAPGQVAEVAPAEPVADIAQVQAAAAPAPVVAVTEVAETAPRPMVGQVVFAERRAVVQPLPPQAQSRPAVAAKAAPLARTTAMTTPTKGNFMVQLGAYDSADMARWGWNQISKRHAALAGQTPYTMPIGNGLVRVAVGGFARGDADRMCRSIRAKGGICFVRANAGDQVASWARGNVQYASARTSGGNRRAAAR